MGRCARVFLIGILAATFGSVQLAYAQGESQNQQNPPADQNSAKKSAKQKGKSDKELRKELDSQYRKWLDEDVVYIISPEERSAFLHLATNEEREQFIEQFWQRRNPDPDSADNTFKEEHYRRIAYVNEHFSSGIPGWKTDRGRIYIMWGPADEIESHPSGGSYERPAEEGGGETSTYPFEDWRYRYLEGIGENVILEFVDPTMSGEYHLTMDPSEKDALLMVPGAGLTEMESMGLASKTARFNNTDGTHDAAPIGMATEAMNEFTRLELYAKIQQAPPVKFKDLEAVVTSRLVRDQVKFDYRFYFLRITSDTVLVPITVQIPTGQLSFQEKQGVDSATVNLFARISTLSGRIVQTFEDTVKRDVPASLLQQARAVPSIYQKAVPLSPGLYRLDIVLKDVNNGNVGVVNTRLAVPRFEDDHLSSSSLILADQITPVSSKDIGLGQFVLGDVKVRPKLDASFAASDGMGVFLQIYNLKVDDQTHKSDATVQYRVMKDKTTEPVLKFDIPKEKLPEHGEELTLENIITLGSLPPGAYKLEVAVTDNLTKQTITPAMDFTVKAGSGAVSHAR
ncbi:MAG TPA: GWxTD domain-containing protein [Candidatus Binatus sp.]|jgi:GWxTD domain-containing protein|nr:GWxTD domain-containing protein [Candidatus Binatus sp.]